MPELTGLWGLSLPGALVGVVVFAYLTIIRGWLIPKATHERELAAERRRADEWKETALKSAVVVDQQRAQITALIEGARTSAHFFSQVPVKEESGHVDTA